VYSSLFSAVVLELNTTLSCLGGFAFSNMAFSQSSSFAGEGVVVVVAVVVVEVVLECLQFSSALYSSSKSSSAAFSHFD